MSSDCLYRGTDPDTSAEAARYVVESGIVANMMLAALLLLVRYPGLTACELEVVSGLTDGKIRKRLNDLRHRQLARKGERRKCRVTGRQAYTWHPGEVADSEAAAVALENQESVD